MEITLQLDEARAAIAIDRVAGVAERLRDDRLGMVAIRELIIASTHQTFEAEGRPDPWPDLAESTKQRRRNRGGLLKILFDTGYLSGSVTGTEDAPYAVGGVENHRVTVGTNRPGAEVHQHGAARTVTRKVRQKLGPGRKKGVHREPVYVEEQHEVVFPMRKFLLHQEQDRADYRAAYQDFILGNLEDIANSLPEIH